MFNNIAFNCFRGFYAFETEITDVNGILVGGMRNSNVLNNTFVVNNSENSAIGVHYNPQNNIQFVNNIIDSNSQTTIVYFDGDPTGVYSFHNNLWTAGAPTSEARGVEDIYGIQAELTSIPSIKRPMGSEFDIGAFEFEGDPIMDVIISEINWSGSTNSEDDEWIELHNTTDQDIVLDGWTIQNSA